MARGDPAFPLENLVPYLRGGRYAMVPVRSSAASNSWQRVGPSSGR